jgi:hypothetical protein
MCVLQDTQAIKCEKHVRSIRRITKKRTSYLTLGMYEVRFVQETRRCGQYLWKMIDTYFSWISLYVGKSKNFERIVIKYSDPRFCTICHDTVFVCVRRIGWYVKVKREAVPLQAWSGPEDSRNSRFPVFMTTAQDGGKVISHTHRPPLAPGNTPNTHFC